MPPPSLLESSARYQGLLTGRLNSMGGLLVEMSISSEQRGGGDGGGGSNKGVFLCSGNPRMSEAYSKYVAGFFESKCL